MNKYFTSEVVFLLLAIFFLPNTNIAPEQDNQKEEKYFSQEGTLELSGSASISYFKTGSSNSTNDFFRASFNPYVSYYIIVLFAYWT